MQFMRSLSDPAEDDALLVINGSRDEATVTLPVDGGAPWSLEWDSAWESPSEATHEHLQPGSSSTMRPMTIRLYISPPPV